jgi:salicylate hydroxylase
MRGRQHCWLTAAIALRRAGHKVAIYEASGFQNEADAALCLSPNAPHLFLAWGIDPDALRFALPDVNSKPDGFIT